MAANTGASKRQPIKWIRDGAKAAYVKMPCCFVCASTEELELHHTHSLTNLLEKWAKEQGISIATDDDVLEIRDSFIAQHDKEIYGDVFTLCLKHHRMLHGIYGKAPLLSTAAKQSSWINKQRDKFNGLDTKEYNSKLDTKTESSSRPNSKTSWLQCRVGSNLNLFTGLRTI